MTQVSQSSVQEVHLKLFLAELAEPFTVTQHWCGPGRERITTTLSRLPPHSLLVLTALHCHYWTLIISSRPDTRHLSPYIMQLN